MPVSRSATKLAAFLVRLFRRSLGHPWYKFGENIERRSADYLTKLRVTNGSLKLAVSLENLAREYDLLDGENALKPNALALQLMIFELSVANEIAREITRMMLNDPPMSKLFTAILNQASSDGASSIAITFANDGPDNLKVSFLMRDRWIEAMTIPPTLDKPFRGIAYLVEKMNYRCFLENTNDRDNLPESATFNWRSDNELEIVISNSNE